MTVLQSWLGVGFDATKLLWRGSTDGFTARAFHKRCDKQGPTLTVIESTEGWIFGGYNPSNWQSAVPGSYVKKANGSFIFTLKNQQDISPTRFFRAIYAFYNNANSGPDFGCSDLVVFNTAGKSYSYFPNSYVDTTGKGNALFTGKKNLDNFEVKEIEVYSV